MDRGAIVVKLELSLTLDPFILTLSLELRRGGVHLTWAAFNALDTPKPGPTFAPREEAAA